LIIVQRNLQHFVVATTPGDDSSGGGDALIEQPGVQFIEVVRPQPRGDEARSRMSPIWFSPKIGSCHSA
jgi:hypothetical protein